MAHKRLKKLRISFFRNRFNTTFLITVLLLSIAIFIFFSRINSIVLYPNLYEINYGCFNDQGNNGTSVIKNVNISDSLIKFDFELNKGFYNPYVGINIAPKSNSFFNFKFLNQITLELNIQGLENIGVYIGQIENKSSINDLTFFHSLKVLKGRNIYNLDLNEFKVPDWSINYNDLHAKEKIKLNLEQISFINITTAYPTTAGDKGKFNIYSIKVERNNNKLIISLLLLCVASLGLLIIIQWLRVKIAQKTDEVKITYNPIQIESETANNNDYIAFIGNNFHNPELTLNLVAKQTSTGQRVIANNIFESYGCNFKTYINQIRINESKRLLKETKLNIGEIAYKVGFNSQSHFNRVFKSLVDVSPTAFRESNN